MRMFGASVDLELAVDGTAEAVVRNHASDSPLDEELGAALAALAEGLGLVTADEPGEAHVGLLSLLFAADLYFGGVNDNDEVTGVYVGGEDCLVLSTEEIGGLDGDVAEVLVLGVDHPPLAFDLGSFCGESLHEISGKMVRLGASPPSVKGEKGFFQEMFVKKASQGNLLACA